MLPRNLFLAFANAELGLNARRVLNVLCAKTGHLMVPTRNVGTIK
jgi:hypothetical protein